MIMGEESPRGRSLTHCEGQALRGQHVRQLAPPAAQGHKGAHDERGADGEADGELGGRQDDDGQEQREGQHLEHHARPQQRQEPREVGRAGQR